MMTDDWRQCCMIGFYYLDSWFSIVWFADCRFDSFKTRTMLIKIIQSLSCDRLSNANRNWLGKTTANWFICNARCAIHSEMLNCFVNVRLLLDNSLKQTCLFNYYTYCISIYSLCKPLLFRYLLEKLKKKKIKTKTWTKLINLCIVKNAWPVEYVMTTFSNGFMSMWCIDAHIHIH